MTYFESKKLIKEQVGEKAYNLYLLDGLFNDLKLNVKVPTFQAVTSDQVISFLLAHDLDLVKEWTMIVDEIMQNDKKLSPATQKKLEDLQAKILATFQAYDFPLALDSRLEQTADKEIRLMVRSTGAEDKKELANAGGNESKENVSPHIKNISQAMGEVVASYFGPKSLLQRLAMNDDLTKPLCAPVLLQEMISDKEGKLPVSGVGFVADKSVLLQYTLGHGSMVVKGNEYTAVDSALVFPTDERIHLETSCKHFRLGPKSGQEGLILLENRADLVAKHCLTEVQINELAKALKAIEEYYKVPMDIEFVVQDNTIYIVQARPIQSTALEKQLTVPTAFKKEAISSWKNNKAWLGGETIAPSGVATHLAHVQEIKAPSDVVLLDWVNDEDLKNLMANPPKLIIVSTRLVRTSHEITTLSGAGIPVLYIKDMHKAKSFFESSPYPIYHDWQQSGLVSQKNIEGDPNNVIIEGLVVSPISEYTSIPDNISLSTEELDYLKNHIIGTTAQELKVDKLRSSLEKLSLMKTPEDVTLLLNQITNLVISRTLNKTYPEDLSAQMLQLIISYHKDFQVRGKPNLDLAKKIEGLFYAQPEQSILVSSVVSDIKYRKDKAIYLSELKKMGFSMEDPRIQDDKFLALFSYRKILLNEGTKKEWADFCLELLESPADFQYVFYALRTLQQHQLMEAFFYGDMLKNGALNIKNFKSNFELVYGKLAALESAESAINRIKNNQGMFQDATTLPKGIEELKSLVEVGRSLVQSIPQTQEGSVAYQAKLKNVLLNLIDCMDTSIKVMKSTPIDPIEDKIARFQELLQVYKELHHILIRDALHYDDYCDYLDHIFESNLYNKTQEELLPSGRLSAAASSFYAPGDMSRAFQAGEGGVTWEDLFWRLHQNMIDSVLMLSGNTIDYSNYLDESLQTFFKGMQQIKLSEDGDCTLFDGDKEQAMGKLAIVKYNYPFVTYHYSIPLQNHAAQIVFSLDVRTNKVKIDYHAYGLEGLGMRLATSCLLGAILWKYSSQSEQSRIHYIRYPQKNTVGSRQVSYSVDMPVSALNRDILEMLRAICDVSIGSPLKGGDTDFMQNLSRDKLIFEGLKAGFSDCFNDKETRELYLDYIGTSIFRSLSRVYLKEEAVLFHKQIQELISSWIETSPENGYLALNNLLKIHPYMHYFLPDTIDPSKLTSTRAKIPPVCSEFFKIENETVPELPKDQYRLGDFLKKIDFSKIDHDSIKAYLANSSIMSSAKMVLLEKLLQHKELFSEGELSSYRDAMIVKNIAEYERLQKLFDNSGVIFDKRLYSYLDSFAVNDIERDKMKHYMEQNPPTLEEQVMLAKSWMNQNNGPLLESLFANYPALYTHLEPETAITLLKKYPKCFNEQQKSEVEKRWFSFVDEKEQFNVLMNHDFFHKPNEQSLEQLVAHLTEYKKEGLLSELLLNKIALEVFNTCAEHQLTSSFLNRFSTLGVQSIDLSNKKSIDRLLSSFDQGLESEQFKVMLSPQSQPLVDLCIFNQQMKLGQVSIEPPDLSKASLDPELLFYYMVHSGNLEYYAAHNFLNGFDNESLQKGFLGYLQTIQPVSREALGEQIASHLKFIEAMKPHFPDSSPHLAQFLAQEIKGQKPTYGNYSNYLLWVTLYALESDKPQFEQFKQLLQNEASFNTEDFFVQQFIPMEDKRVLSEEFFILERAIFAQSVLRTNFLSQLNDHFIKNGTTIDKHVWDSALERTQLLANTFPHDERYLSNVFIPLLIRSALLSPECERMCLKIKEALNNTSLLRAERSNDVEGTLYNLFSDSMSDESIDSYINMYLFSASSAEERKERCQKLVDGFASLADYPRVQPGGSMEAPFILFKGKAANYLERCSQQIQSDNFSSDANKQQLQELKKAAAELNPGARHLKQ